MLLVRITPPKSDRNGYEVSHLPGDFTTFVAIDLITSIHRYRLVKTRHLRSRVAVDRVHRVHHSDISKGTHVAVGVG